MKLLIFVILLMFYLSPKLDATDDTLLVKWNNKELSDSVRTVSFNKYIWDNYIFNNSDSAEFYIEKLIKFSASKDLKTSNYCITNAFMMRGVLKLKSGEYEKALNLFNQSLEKSKNPIDKYNIAQSKFFIATTYYYQGNFELASVLFQEVISIYKELDKKEVLAATYVNLGSVYRDLGDYNNALQNYNGALFIYIKLDMKEEISAIYNNLGLIYAEKGEYVNALDYFDKSIHIKDELKDRAGKASTFHNIGLIYQEFQEFDKALKYFNQSIEIEKEMNNIRGIANTYIELGEIQKDLKNYSKAFEYLEQSLEIYEEIGDKSGVAISLLTIGKVYTNQHKYEKAKEYYIRSLDSFEETGEIKGISNALSSLGLTNIAQGNIREALANCKRSEMFAKETEDIITNKLYCDCLYQAYKLLSKPAKALHYYEQLIVLRDKTNTIEASKDIQKVVFQKAKLADSLRQEEKRLTTKLEFENRISEENQQRNIALAIGLIFVLVAGGLYSRNRYISKTKNEISNEKDRSEKLLLNILPAEIAKELKEKGKSEARDFDNVSIMFTDFKEFTQASEQLTAHQLIDEINFCFEFFDKICDKYRIEKIKTIGDSYMAAGGLPIPFEESTKNTVLAAIEIANFISQRQLTRQNEGSLSFEMRIGIHTGPVVAGIVGVKKFQYDIWGDTVNTASRMESAGEVGKVNISQSTYELIKNDTDFVFEHRGKVQAKGKGQVDMYFVKSADKL